MQFTKLTLSTPISKIGLGCLQIVEPVSTAPAESEAISLIKQARETGINFFDTSDIYGLGKSESILGKALNLSELTETERQHIIIATKCGLIRTDSGLIYNGSKDHIKKACEESLTRLGTPYIDIYYLHRIDEKVPLRESMEAMAELLAEGKIRYVGLSEVTLEQVLEANEIVKISFVQNEFSLMERTDEYNGLIEACAKMSIFYVPYCPLGRGLLSTEITGDTQFSSDDFRSQIPRLQAKYLLQNISKRRQLESIASTIGCSTAQLSLAWVLSKGEHILPIPGTRTSKYLAENAKAVEIEINETILEFINTTFHQDYFHGERSPTNAAIREALSSPKLGGKLKASEQKERAKQLTPVESFSQFITEKFINSPVFTSLKSATQRHKLVENGCKSELQEFVNPPSHEPEAIHVTTNTK